MKFFYNRSLLSENKIQKTADSLLPYIKHLQLVADKAGYADVESTINLPTDKKMLQEIIAMAKQKATPKLKYFIDIAIGASDLGAKAWYDAFWGFYDLLQPERFPKTIFLETPDEELLTKTIRLLTSLKSKEEFLINAVSKSGGTPETVVNLEVILDALKKRFGDVNDRLIISAGTDTPMFKLAKEKKLPLLEMVKNVGGRYSVFSSQGLLAAAVTGLDMQALCQGAVAMRQKCLDKNLLKNPAALSASIIFQHYQSGKNISDTFIFLPQLETLGKWYRQLMGESVGKEYDLAGKKVRQGITPTISIGSTDLHSVGQLYLGGPRNRISTFVWGENKKYEATIPQEMEFPVLDAVAGKSTHTFIRAVIEGVKIAYQKQQLPYMEVVLDTVSEYSIGEFMQFKMIEMMYLGKLMNVNAFDQPNVELYKKETRRILKST